MSMRVTMCALPGSACCFRVHLKRVVLLQIRQTPLHAAARYCQKEMVQLLLSHGAYASARDHVSEQVAEHSRQQRLLI